MCESQFYNRLSDRFTYDDIDYLIANKYIKGIGQYHPDGGEKFIITKEFIYEGNNVKMGNYIYVKFE